MEQQQQPQQQVPRETPMHVVSQSVISSSNINQGDHVAATSSSSSTIAPPALTATLNTPTTLTHTMPSPAIPNPTTIYALLSDINCSSNAKTYHDGAEEGGIEDEKASISCITSSTSTNIAGKTKSLETEEDWTSHTTTAKTKMTTQANSNAILALRLRSDDRLTTPSRAGSQGLNYANKVFDQLSGSKPTTRNTQNSWVESIEGPASNKGWGIPKGLGLRGGGENSLNAGTSGWGTPPAAGGAGWGGAAPGQGQGQWGGNRPPGPAPNPNPNPAGPEFNSQNKPGSAAPPGVAAGAGNAASAPVGSAGGAGGAPTGGQSPASAPGAAAGAVGNTSWAQAAGKGLPQGPAPAQSSTTKQIEQLNSMREALFAQDGWGGQHVNQDTSWDTPGSPEPSKGGDPAGSATAPLWKQNVNNGTDLWEANLRNGGQPPAQPQSKTPWGHTPTTNIGGTWGEEDESNESCNVWTGAPGAPGAPGAQAPWPGAPAGPWPEKKPEWGAGPGAAAATSVSGQWGGAPVPHIDARDPRDPRDPNNRDMLPLNDMNLMRMRGDGGVMRGDPRGVSGRLNNTEQMWAAHQPPPTPKIPNLPPAGNQWSSGLPKEMGGMVNAQGKPSGWEEPSPPAQRRNIPNYDDGTSLWGQQPQTRLPQPAPVAPNKNLAHWDKLPGNNMGRGNMPCPTGMPGARMPTAGAVKPDCGPVWSQGGGRNGAWDHDGGWNDENKLTGNWPGESPLTPPSWPGGKPGGWGEDAADGSAWSHPSMQRPTLPKLSSDAIYNSKQYLALCEMNYKKEDIEVALRKTNMNLPESMELLGNWGRREENPYEQPMLRGAGFNPVQPLGFAGGPGTGANNPALNLNKMGMMAQGQVGGGQGGQGGLVAGQNRLATAQPSAQQLKLLIQQIQMAVQTGYLNHQILNQPLAPPTLLLVNQLLQQIKNLQQLNQRHQLLTMSGQLKNNATLLAQLSVQMNKTKQNIQSFQSQITGHQANYMKQQQPQQPQQLAPHSDSASDLFKSPFTDPLAPLPNFPDLSISGKTSMQSSFQTQSQSRLNQWKLPSLDKEGDGNEFSRAPGSAKGHSSNMNETWSTVGGRVSDGGWPDSTTNELGDKDSQWSAPQQSNSMADFIPEFEPGKPWKGTQMKTVEEDPSMTPGSVARSPLTMASIKDSDILSDSNKASPGSQGPSPGQDSAGLTSLGLSSSSPWNSGTSSVYTSTLSKLTSSKSWGESIPTSQSADLWLAPGKTARGPPPGLGAKLGQTQPNWAGAGSRSSWGNSPSSWGSPWLILRNLTPQIDGSTLKTLCMQHGPLQNFHLHLNVGTALAKYSSREEANKAQQALNNCVLGNTTIFAESPGESEVATLLNQLGHSNPQNNQQQQQPNWNIRTSQAQANPSKANDTWATSAGSLPGYAGSGNLWQSTSSSSSLWGSDGDAHRSTPSGASLNSFLPPDLLNGETM